MGFAERINSRLRRNFVSYYGRTSSLIRPTFLDLGRGEYSPIAKRFSFIDAGFIQQLSLDFPGYADLIQKHADRSLRHCFDLLGSGPCVVAYGMSCDGILGVSYSMSQSVNSDRSGVWLQGRINRANIKESKRIWGLVGEKYVPIDWQMDFKSGFRWSEHVWYSDIQFAHLPGVDVKVPWELGRMQHLPSLGFACHYAHKNFKGFLKAEVYANEVRNQIIDFIATNPPGFGVNWVCTMDVAIRAANLLVARDIVVASGFVFDEEFERIFFASMLAHAKHIVANLEWAPQYRGNHYLADIVGLLYISVYFSSNEEVDAWLAFSVQELLAEISWQFHEDGSSFEASVCYHRLSAEMLLWAFALICDLSPQQKASLLRPQRHRLLARLRQEPINFHGFWETDRKTPIPMQVWIKLSKMRDFTLALTRPDGMVVQFGDNDSGRFITLGSGEQLCYGDDPGSMGFHLDHRGLIAGINALINSGHNNYLELTDPGAKILQRLAGINGNICNEQAQLIHQQSLGSEVGGHKIWVAMSSSFNKTHQKRRWVSEYPSKIPGIIDDLQLFSFPGMGCYVFKSPHLYLAIRCGEIGIAGLGAHAHCDQLAIELMIDGATFIRDPGTMIYTPFKEIRNAYRSAQAHHVPRVFGREPADMTQGIFDLRGGAEGECLYFGSNGFVGRHRGYGAYIYRMIVLENARIVIRDFSEGDLTLIDPTPANLPFSPGYGLTLV